MNGSRRRRLGLRAVYFGMAAALLTGCGSKEPSPPPDTPEMDLVVAPAALSVVAGASANADAAITRSGGYAGIATMSSSGAPTGMTITFGTPVIPSGSTTSTVAVATLATVAAGAYPIIITATGTEVTAVGRDTITVTVTASPVPGATLALSPTSATVQAGAANVTSTATVTRTNGFAGALTLSHSGAPTGVTVTYAPNPVAAASTTSTVTFAVAASTAPGTYPIVISAAGTGITSPTATYTLTVTAPPAGTTIALNYCAAGAPIWLAVQDGTGPWTRVTSSGNNAYSFTLNSARGGIATVDTIGTGFELTVTYATAAEMAAFGPALNNDACGSKTVNGTFTNVSTTQSLFVTLGSASVNRGGAAGTGTFQLTSVPSGALDLMATRMVNSTRRLDRMILRRNVDIANNGSLPVLDFSAAESFAPATANVTVANVSPDTGIIVTAFNGLRGNAFGFMQAILRYLPGSGAVGYDVIPAARLNAGELQQLYVAAIGANNQPANRISGVFLTGPTDITLTLGPALGNPTVTRATDAPYARPRVQLAVQSDYSRALFLDFAQSALNRTGSVTATGAYTAGAAWDITVPDLSGAAGWQNTWALQPGTPFDWGISAIGGGVYLLDPTITPGTLFKSATRESSAPVP
jgi:hypothetical protein